MIKYGEIGAKPVGYLVLAWIAGIGSALLVAGLIVPVIVAYSGVFDAPLWQQALVGLLIVPIVMMTQYVVAFTFCSAILHSRSQTARPGEAIGTGYQNSNIVVALPFETTPWSRFWVAMHYSGWRVAIAIYAVVLAVVVTSAGQDYLVGALLIAAAVALGFWHASHVARKRVTEAVDDEAAAEKQARYEKGLAARERKAARDLEAAQTAEITDALIDRELKKAFTKTMLLAAQKGDEKPLDVAAQRAHAALAGRVPIDELRARALAWASVQQL